MWDESKVEAIVKALGVEPVPSRMVYMMGEPNISLRGASGEIYDLLDVLYAMAMQLCPPPK